MKKIIICCLMLGLPLAAYCREKIPQKIESFEDAVAWMSSYHTHKDPVLLTAVIRTLGKSGSFEAWDTGGSYALGFLASVFSQNPDKLQGWFKELSDLPPHELWVAWSALAIFKSEQGQEILKSAFPGLSIEQQIYMHGLLKASEQDPLTVELGSGMMETLWGMFYATGDERYVQRIISGLAGYREPSAEYYSAPNEQEILAHEVKRSLTEDATRHDLVLDICRREQSRQPGNIGRALELIVQEAEQARVPVPQEIQDLIMRARSEDAGEREAAVNALGEKDSKIVIDQLMISLSDGDLKVKKAAIRALARTDSREYRVVFGLLNALYDYNLGVGVEARNALVPMGDPYIVTACLKALGDSRPQVRANSAYILGKKRISTARAALQELLAEEKDAMVSQAIRQALEEIDR